MPELYIAPEGIKVQSVRRIRNLRLGVEQPENALCTRHSRLYRVKLFRKLLDRLKKFAYIPLERHEGTYRHDTLRYHLSAANDENRERKYIHNIRHRTVKRKREKLLHISPAQRFGLFPEITAHIALGVKGLNHLHAHYPLGHEPVQVGYQSSYVSVYPAGRFCKNERCYRNERYDDKYMQSQIRIIPQHHNNHAYQQKKSL